MPETRIFVTLTLEEAACLCRVAPGPELAASRALDKIRTAYQGATSPQPSALSSEPLLLPKLLRAKDYRQLPMAKAAIRPPRPHPPGATHHTRDVPPVSAATGPGTRAIGDDTYTPCRDEAGGIWR